MKNAYLNLNSTLTVLLLLIGSLGAHAQNSLALEWVRGIGETGTDIAMGITVDKRGNVYTTGYFSGNVAFDPGGSATHQAQAQDIFITKFDAAGNFVWARTLGGTANDQGRSITVDSLENVYITGVFRNKTDFNPATGAADTFFLTAASTNTDAFTMKLDAQGHFVWARSLGSDQNLADEGLGIATDNQLNVYTTGFYRGKVDFNPGTGAADTFFMTSASNSSDLFVWKLDASGDFVWAKGAGSNRVEQGNGITIDNSGNICITGLYAGKTDMNTGSGAADTFFLTPSGGDNDHEIFVLKLENNGNFLWAKSMGSPTGSNDRGTGITADNNDNLYITGWYTGKADMNPGTGAADTFFLEAINGQWDAEGFIAKLDANGNFVWAGALMGGDDYTPESYSITLDPAGNVYATGMFSGSVDFNPGKNVTDTAFLTAAGGSDAFITKLSTDGIFIHAWAFGNSGASAAGRGVASDKHGNIYLAGNFSGTIDFEPGSGIPALTATGTDAFVLKLACTDTSSHHIQTSVCDTLIVNGHIYTENGTFYQVIPNAAGCDSTIRIELTIIEVVPVINPDGDVLSTTAPYTSYEWYREGTGKVGEDSAYTVEENGFYYVIVTDENGCTGISEKYEVTNVVVRNIPRSVPNISIHPNPAQHTCYIHALFPVDVTIHNLEGRIIKTFSKVNQVSVSDLADGVYVMRIVNQENGVYQTEKLIKGKY